MCRLLGGQTHNGLALSTGEIRGLEKLYGFTDEYYEDMKAELKLSYEQSLVRHTESIAAYDAWRKSPFPRTPRYLTEPGKPPKEPDYEGAVKLSKAGAFRNLMRFAEKDGLRVMAVLAKYMEDEKDPLELIAHLLAEAGFDTAGLEEFYED
jgi:hypothetical protein